MGRQEYLKQEIKTRLSKVFSPGSKIRLKERLQAYKELKRLTELYEQYR